MITGSIVLFKTDVNQVSEVIHSFFKGDSKDRILYLIDNSPNDVLRFLANLYPGCIEYIFTGKNLGYGTAHNIALEKALNNKARYHVVLNPDLSFDADTIPRLSRFMDNHLDVGLSMPKVVNPDGSIRYICRLLPTPMDLVLRCLFSKSRYAQKRNFQFEMRESGYNEVMDVPFISGCFMFFRVDILPITGLFDEHIFMYFEDVDLSRRVHEKFRTCLYPNAQSIHLANRESHRNWRMLFVHVRSAFYYFNKWGWFFDNQRDQLNRRALDNIKKLNSSDTVVK